MSRRAPYRFASDEDGGTLVEFAVVLAVFLLIFFGLIDFGRLAFHYVTAERAMHVAARIAAVRPAACAGVPDTHTRAAGSTEDFGTRCTGGGICLAVSTVACAGNTSNPTVAEIWPIVRGALPNDATPANLRFSYAHDPNLGFLGGPYVPVVTVELQDLTFRFISPLGAFVAMTGATPSASLGADIAFPPMSVSLPGEDLAQGNEG